MSCVTVTISRLGPLNLLSASQRLSLMFGSFVVFDGTITY